MKRRNLAVFVLVLFSDQISKLYASGKGQITWNEGGVFGLNPGLNWILISLGLFWALFFMVRKTRGLERLGIVVILAAGAGNFLDRVTFGRVRDFIYYPFLGTYGNAADIFLGVGCLILLYAQIRKPYVKN